MKRTSLLLITCTILLTCLQAVINADTSEKFLSNKVSLTLDHTPIKDVIRLLAKQNNFNLAISGDLQGEATIMLTDVPLGTALDAVLLPNNLTWYIKDNIMVVKSSGTLAEDERMTLVINLMYASAQHAQQATTALLSSGGKIEVLAEESGAGDKKGQATTLVVSDRKSVVDRVVEVIRQLDKPEPQLNIEVKLVETSLSKENKIGIDWPESYNLLFGSVATETNPGGYLASHPLDGGKWIWGTFAAANVQTALDVMLKSGNSKLLSTPNLTTVSNQPAEIAITTTIPVQTLNRFTEGAVIQDIVSFQDLDVGITLRVTGRVNDSGYISLTVNPVIEEITGYTGPINNQRPITSKRELNTNVRVKDGMTLVMGGLLRESKIKNVQKLPLLGDIPLIGGVFRHTHDQLDKTDLTVFITPKVMPAN